MSEPQSPDGQSAPTPPPVPPTPAAAQPPPMPPSAYPAAPPPTYPSAYPAEPAAPAAPQPTPAPAYDPYAAQPQQYGQPAYGYQQYAYPAAPASDVRPGTVTTSFVITWVLLTLNFLALIVLIALAASTNTAFFNGALDDGSINLTVDEFRRDVLIGSIILMIWTLIAAGISIPAFRRQNWARITLAISGGISVPVQFLAFAAVVPLFFAIGTITAIVLMFTGGANEWYRARNTPLGTFPQAPPGATFYQ